MRLSHLLLAIFLDCGLALPLAWLLGQAGVSLTFERRMWISFIPAMLAGIAVAWPVARRLGVPPLMIFSGPCPACGRRPSGWWNLGVETDQMRLACGECGVQVRLWLTSWRRPNVVSSAMPTYALRWPGFLGVWRRVDTSL
jgi:hypothetical protein